MTTYTPPAGNAVNLGFTLPVGGYTPPLGSAVTLTFSNGNALNIDPGVYLVTGSNVGLLYGRRLTVGTGVYSIAGSSSLLLRGYAIFPTSGSYLISGSSVSLKVGRQLNVAGGAYVLTGSGVGLLAGRRLVVGSGAYSLVGSALTTVYARMIQIGLGVYSIVGAAVQLIRKAILRISSGTYSLAGSAVSLLYGRRLVMGSHAFVISGTTLTFTYHQVTKIVPDEGVYTLVGGDVTFIYNRRLTATPGTYLVQGRAVSLLVARKLNFDAGSYAIVGTDPTLSQGGRTLGVDRGVYTTAWSPASMTVSRSMALAPGTYAVAGSVLQLRADRRLALGGGIYTIVDTPNFSTNYVNNGLLTNDDAKWYFGEQYGGVRNATRVATGDPSLPFAFQQTDPTQNGFVGQNNDLVWTGPGGLELQGSPAPPFDQLTLSWKIKPGFPGQEFAINVFWYTDTTFITTTGFLEFPTDTSQFGAYSAVVDKPPGALHFLIEAACQPGGVGYFGGIRLDGFSPMQALVGRKLNLGPGSYTLNGTDIRLPRGYEIRSDGGTYTMVTAPVSLLANRIINFGSRAYQITWTEGQINYHRTQPGPHSLVVDEAANRLRVVGKQNRTIVVGKQDRKINIEHAPSRVVSITPADTRELELATLDRVL